MPTRHVLPLALLVAAVPALAAQAPPTLDLVIRGGTVIDGSGGQRFRADVGILGDRIAAVGDLGRRRARDTIDATGLVVAPGFVNVHSHAEAAGLQVADNMLSQGVTTEILNADGHGPLDIPVQLAAADSMGLALNVGAAIGFNSVWAHVVGAADRRPTDEEVARMQGLIRRNLEGGAFAVSAGLDYKPGFFATEDEVVRVLEPARRWRTNFPNHDRILPQTGYSARAAVEETMRIGERAGLVPVVTHMKVSGRERHQARVVLGEMAALSRRGVYTAADVYPYLSGMTGLSSLIIPGWALSGGADEMRRRFADSATRARIVAEADRTIAARFTGADGILVLTTGRTLSDHMREFGTTSPAEAVVTLLATRDHRAILGFGEEDDLERILRFPSAAVSCDCGASLEPTGHPRNHGTFPRVLGRYVRERRVLTWEDAIRKMSALPATMVGLIDRGYVAVGMHADLAIFDSAAVIDRATFQEPGLRSEGFRHVVVNGRVALRDGTATGERAGRALARASWMPSRPMSMPTVARRLRVRGTATPIGDGGTAMPVRLDLRQAVGARAATGVVTLGDARAVSLGVLQAAPHWWSVTGRMRRPGGVERGFVLTVEGADPFVEGTPRTVTVQMDGDAPMRARLP